jgi:hypothetical protein
LPHRGYDRRGVGDNHIWRQFYQLCRVGLYASRVTAGPAIVDAHVAAFYPSQFLKPLLQRFDPSLSYCVISDTHEHADTPHALWLLRARRERPCDRRAADERDELAAFQLIELHSIPASQGLEYRISSWRRIVSGYRNDCATCWLLARTATATDTRPA